MLKFALAGAAAGALPPRGAGAQQREVRVAVFTGLNRFDPLGNFTELFIMRAVHPPLTRVVRKASDPLDGWEPFAATPSRLSFDGRRFYLDIKALPQLKWSGGRQNTIEEIVRGIERARQNPPPGARVFFDALDELQVQGAQDCRAYLKSPETRLYKDVFARTWLTPLTSTGFAPPRPGAVSFAESLGPYRFENPFVPGREVTLKANPAWGKPLPVHTFTIHRFDNSDMDEVVAKFNARSYQLVLLPSGTILGSDRDIVEQYGSLAEAKIQPIDAVTYVAIGLGSGATRDPRVRQAVRAAIDPAKVVQAAYGRSAEPTSDILPAGFTSEKPSATRWYDVASAKRLLAEAGFGAGFDAEFLLPKGAGPIEKRMAANVAEQMAVIGVKLETTEIDFAPTLRSRQRPAFQVWRTPVAHTPAAIYANFTSVSPTNLPGLNSPEFDKAVQELGREPEKWLQPTRELFDKESPLIPICQERSMILSQRDLLAGFAPDGTFGDLVDVDWSRT